MYGTFHQSGFLSICAGGLIPFDGAADASGICQSGGELTLSRAGVYLITLHVTVPACDALKTTFRIRLNAEAVSCGALVIDKECAGAPMHTSVQAVIRAHAGDVLSVTTGGCVELSACAGSDPIATLTVARIGC